MIPQKREGKPHLRKGSDQPPPKPPQHALPYHKLQSLPRSTTACPPFPQTAPRPTNNTDDAATVREDTPWPSTGKMSENLFEERNWVLPKGLFSYRRQKGGCYSSKKRMKIGRANLQTKGRKMWLGTQLPLL